MSSIQEAKRLILSKLRDLMVRSKKEGIRDDEIAQETNIPLEDIRDYLRILKQDGFVGFWNTADGFSAAITPLGRLELGEIQDPVDPALRLDRGRSRVDVAPKGLRSYDKDDAAFFPKLLPGPYPGGLPEIIQFWITRIEKPEPDSTFRVGVIYGPSGSGKSSIVKAGLLPRLSDHVLRVYVESTPDQTESSLNKGIRWKCPKLSPTLDLIRSLESLHDEASLAPGMKLLLILDQFEQWLVANRGRKNPDLVRALGHCDEERVRSILVVRDEFLSATIQFMDEIGIEFRPALNARRVELERLFTTDHAEQVLEVFGRHRGKIRGALQDDQNDFIKAAINSLSDNGEYVVPVRLALFYETFKNREWAMKTFKEISDAEGVEVAYLEGIFNSHYADPWIRSHQEAALSVLGALLPERSDDIKPPRRPRRDLLIASGYTERPDKFENLLSILDKDLFLVTPIDQEAEPESDGGGRVDRMSRVIN